MSNKTDIEVVYDRQCPVCEFYCQSIDVEPEAGTLHRIDARDPSDIMTEITARNLDIDEGMVVRMGDTIYYGSEAINMLALHSSRRGLVNRLAAMTFRSSRVSRVLYPVLKACRNLLLKVLGRSRINNLGTPRKDRF